MDDARSDKRHDEPEVHAQGRIHPAEQLGELGGCLDRLGDRVISTLALEELGLEEEVDESQRDVVEHDRDDDLVRTGFRLEDARDEAPDGTADEAGEECEGQVDVDRQPGDAEADEHRAHAADKHLPLAADVEQARPKGDCHGQAGEDERGCCGEGLGDGLD